MPETPLDQLHMHGVDPLHGKRFLVRKRDGRIEEFNEARILLAIESAFKAHLSLDMDAALPAADQAAAKHCADKVAERALASAVRGEKLEVEGIQDMVENQLMLEGHLEVVRRYILYREKRRLARAEREELAKLAASPKETLEAPIADAGSVSPQLKNIYRQALPRHRAGEGFERVYRRHFDGCLNECEYWRFLSAELLDYDSDFLARGLKLEGDQQFSAAGLEALREHFLLRENARCLETPQYFWMRVAMGLTLNEAEAQERLALDFYEALSSFRFIPSEKILSGAGTRNPSLAAAAADDASVLWIEPWRKDIFDGLDSKRIWLPDLFMKRVRQQGYWCLFDPQEVVDLHESYGSEFERKYIAYEQKAEKEELNFSQRMKAVDVWNEIVASIVLTRQPWLGFKDAVGLRSPCAHFESADGPVGAINLAAHISAAGKLDEALLRGTVASAVRMLDNALDLSLYPTEQARLRALEQRAIGLGVAGFQESLDRLHVQFESEAAAEFAEWSTELIAHAAITASADLARERGPFPGFAESKWRDGVLPGDTLRQLSQERGVLADVRGHARQNWASVRELVRNHGMRNGAVTAIAPLEISCRIAGINPSLDPTATAEDYDAKWLVDCAARRQKWIDLGQTLTLSASLTYTAKLADILMQAWEKGIKIIHQPRLAARFSGEAKKVEAAVLA